MNGELRKYIDYLYRGVLAFYPIYSVNREAAPEKRYSRFLDKTNFYSKEEFLNLVFDVTAENNIDSALQKLMAWRENATDSSIPQNIDQLVEAREKQVIERKSTEAKIKKEVANQQERQKRFWEKQREGEKLRKQPPVIGGAGKIAPGVQAQPKLQVEERVKPELKVPWVVAPEAKPKVEFVTSGATVYAIARAPDIPVKLEQATVEKFNQVKNNPAEFTNNFISFFSKPENAPDGTNLQTAQATAITLAANLVSVRAPALKITGDTVVPLPNQLSANLALLSNQEILDKAFGSKKKEALKTMASATVHDALWREAEKRMVDNFFGTKDSQKASRVLYGDKNQAFDIAYTPISISGAVQVPIDINQVFDHAQQVSYLISLPQQQASETIRESFGDWASSFPRPSFGEAARTASSITRWVSDFFGKPIPPGGPNFGMNQLAAMKYFGLVPEMSFVSPELSILMKGVEILNVGVPEGFLIPAGNIGVNFGFGGLGLSFTPAVAETGVGAAAGATGATTGAAVGETAAVAAGAAAETAAVTGTGVAATAGAGAAAGSVVPVLGTIIGAIVGLIAAILPSIAKWLKEHSDDFAAIFLGGGIMGLILGNIFLAAGGLGIGIPLAMYSGGGIRGALGSIGGAIGAIFAGAILPAIMAPLIGFFIGFPIIVALILFIINSGAYVVPPGSPVLVGGTVEPGNITPSRCPVDGGRIGDGSYHPGNETSGHGSSDYWRRMGAPFCRWSLPQTTGCLGPTNSGNVCSNETSRCDYYGFAMDIFPSGSISVYAPLIEGQVVQWKYNGVHFLNGPNGDAGESFGFTDTTGKYSIVLTHITGVLVNENKVYSSGEKIDELFPQKTSSGGNNTHLHIELQVNGVYQQPENYFVCDGTISPPLSSTPEPSGAGNEGP